MASKILNLGKVVQTLVLQGEIRMYTEPMQFPRENGEKGRIFNHS